MRKTKRRSLASDVTDICIEDHPLVHSWMFYSNIPFVSETLLIYDHSVIRSGLKTKVVFVVAGTDTLVSPKYQMAQKAYKVCFQKVLRLFAQLRREYSHIIG